ncbi:DUF4974 domain-containing protein [Flammeovirgaceae bacterium SG7u.111]|nr:DUF4974 domain-containing protein [Flammeovirgaceae bacterium SG7u.132]WPO33900.1 DUF4974 domain-containing protein [Flammeovirgaceae bacterium SG7u.111]
MQFEKYTVEDFIGDESFQKYYFDLSKEDKVFWESWIAKNPEKSLEVEEAKLFLSSLTFDVETLSDDEFHQEFLKLKSKTKPVEKGKAVSFVSVTSSWFGRKAAAVVAFLLVAGVGYYFVKDELGASEPSPNTEIAFVEKKAPFGTKSTFKLPDGTRVKLNSGTTLKVYPDFNRKERRVVLEGEAFFDVTKDQSKPFVIESGNIATTVKGTSFNIEAFENEETIKVAVVTGLVAVTKLENDKLDEQIFLRPDEMLTYSESLDGFSKGSFDKDAVLGWKDGVLYFKDASFEAIQKDLEKWYGVEIEVGNKNILNRPYTGTYKNSSLKEVLEGMSYVLDFKFVIDNNIIYID